MHVCHANTCTYMHTHNLSLKSPQSATGSSFRNFLKWGGDNCVQGGMWHGSHEGKKRRPWHPLFAKQRTINRRDLL